MAVTEEVVSKRITPMIGGDPKTFRESATSSDQVSTKYVLLGAVDIIINLRISGIGIVSQLVSQSAATIVENL